MVPLKRRSTCLALCGLKTNKELPSLNEAAYPGIDLMGSILKLLFYFRTNRFVMLSDIKQAFLMIKLKNEFDKHRFCFFWKRRNELVAYRYKTIVFGYTSSPFILHFVMQHHAESLPDDKCKEILSNNFYVDNLIWWKCKPYITRPLKEWMRLGLS